MSSGAKEKEEKQLACYSSEEERLLRIIIDTLAEWPNNYSLAADRANITREEVLELKRRYFYRFDDLNNKRLDMLESLVMIKISGRELPAEYDNFNLQQAKWLLQLQRPDDWSQSVVTKKSLLTLKKQTEDSSKQRIKFGVTTTAYADVDFKNFLTTRMGDNRKALQAELNNLLEGEAPKQNDADTDIDVLPVKSLKPFDNSLLIRREGESDGEEEE